jgi:hypothetical protein
VSTPNRLQPLTRPLRHRLMSGSFLSLAAHAARSPTRRTCRKTSPSYPSGHGHRPSVGSGCDARVARVARSAGYKPTIGWRCGHLGAWLPLRPGRLTAAGLTGRGTRLLLWMMHASRLTHPELNVLNRLDGGHRTPERILRRKGRHGWCGRLSPGRWCRAGSGARSGGADRASLNRTPWSASSTAPNTAGESRSGRPSQSTDPPRARPRRQCGRHRSPRSPAMERSYAGADPGRRARIGGSGRRTAGGSHETTFHSPRRAARELVFVTVRTPQGASASTREAGKPLQRPPASSPLAPACGAGQRACRVPW